jgi:hypothetical protein
MQAKTGRKPTENPKAHATGLLFPAHSPRLPPRGPDAEKAMFDGST